MSDYLAMAREAYNTSTTFFDSSIRHGVEQSLRQFQGVHPSGSKYHSETYKARSRLFRPKTRTTIRKNEATAAEALFSTMDVISVAPEDPDNAFQEASSVVMQEIMNYRLKKTIPWFLLAMGAYQDAQTVGVCVSHQYWDYDPKKRIDKPCIELLPIENIRIDPGSDWSNPINSSPYVIRMIPMYVKDVRARMKKVDEKTGQPKWKALEDSVILSAMNQSGDTTRLTRERGRTDSKEQHNGIRDFAIVWVHQNFIEEDGKDIVFYTLGTTAMLTDPVPIDEVYFHGRRPFVMGCCILETHKIYPGGVAAITKDVQSEINEIANQRIDNVKFAMNKRYFVKRSKQVDIRSLTRNVPGSVTMLTDLDDVKINETNDVTGSSYQEQDRLNLDFDDIAGAFSQSSVGSNRKLNETVGGMNLLTTNANQVSSYQLRTFVETWVEPVLEQLVLLEQHYETDTVLLAMAGKKANLVQRFGIDGVTDELLMQELTTNVNVGIGSTTPQDQINSFMSAMNNLRTILADGLLEKYGLDVGEVIKELFGKLGYKDGGRFFDTEAEDPQLTSAKQMIQQLQQELSQKKDPAMVAAQVKKINAEIDSIRAKAVQTGVQSAFSATQAGASIAQMPQISPIADAVLQMAGYQPPTPAGIDPNLPIPTGIQAPAMDVNQNTSPGFPPIPDDGQSAMTGIETPTTDDNLTEIQ